MSRWLLPLLGMIAIGGCSASAPPALDFVIDEVVYSEPPHERVILVGRIVRGSVRVGDSLMVKCRTGDVPITVEGIETLGREVGEATLGRISLKVSGISGDEPARGDHVVRAPPAGAYQPSDR